MTFVGLLATGIVVTISTALRVWNRAMRMADLQQEARAVTELLSRDIRGAYLGLPPDSTGYFLGGLVESTTTDQAGPPIDTLELTTESSSLAEVALLPDEVREEWDQQVRPPVTDMVGVRWEWLAAGGGQPEGLYRTTSVVPSAEPEIDLNTGAELGQVTQELISTEVAELRFRYYDGEVWQESWDWREAGNSLPLAVSIELVMRQEQTSVLGRAHDYTFQTVVPIAAH
jgi:hypothetical protein